jgi:hypothetical protein
LFFNLYYLDCFTTDIYSDHGRIYIHLTTNRVLGQHHLLVTVTPICNNGYA